MIDIVFVFKWQPLCIFIKAKKKKYLFSSFNSSKRKWDSFLWIQRLSGNAAITHYMVYKKYIVSHNYFITSTHICLNHFVFILACIAFGSRWPVWNCRYQYSISALLKKICYFKSYHFRPSDYLHRIIYKFMALYFTLQKRHATVFAIQNFIISKSNIFPWPTYQIHVLSITSSLGHPEFSNSNW